MNESINQSINQLWNMMSLQYLPMSENFIRLYGPCFISLREALLKVAGEASEEVESLSVIFQSGDQMPLWITVLRRAKSTMKLKIGVLYLIRG